MSIINDLVVRVNDLEQRLDRLADVEIPPFEIGCRLRNSSDIAAADSSAVILTFDTELFDTDSMHSTVTNTDRITINTPGKYAIWGNVQWEINTAGRRNIALRLNGDGVNELAVTELGADPITTAVVVQTVSTIYDLAAGDYLQLKVLQTSGGSLDVISRSHYSPVLAAWRLA